MEKLVRLYAIVIWLAVEATSSDCPWPKESLETTPLNSACLCSLNARNEFSVQCSSVSFPLLMGVLHGRASDLQLNLLYVNNSIINIINERTFYGLNIKHLQLSFCDISTLNEKSFEGLEDKLHHLYLPDNRIREIPTDSLSTLRHLKLLDLSGNRLTQIPDNAFESLNISTLKLSRNSMTISPNAFGGLEDKLKNLNLKECNLQEVPPAVRRLKSLAFLDLSQNEIRSLFPGALEPLHSLTALNMERNLLQDLHPETFLGVSDTLSSLSFLNNLLTVFPVQAINSLPQLRVLDVGFNLITRLPDNAFYKIKFLTLLAVDGNPLPTLPQSPFRHLNGTLRGMSVGGRYFVCDCKVAWIAEWIRDSDLRVTSRDREPQFCSQPMRLRDQSFYQLSPTDFVCDSSVNKDGKRPEIEKEQSAENLTEERIDIRDGGQANDKQDHFQSIQSVDDYGNKNDNQYGLKNSRQPGLHRRPSIQNRESSAPSRKPTESPIESITTYKPPLRSTSGIPRSASSPSPGKVEKDGNYGDRSYEDSSVKESLLDHYEEGHKEIIRKGAKLKRPALVVRPTKTRNQNEFYSDDDRVYGQEVIVQDGYWDQNAINIQWDSEVSNILGFRVVYRLFGDNYFKMGQPLSPSAREFKIKNVPPNEYFVACVVSLEEMDIKLDSVPFGQCKEIRTGGSPVNLSTHMDKIIIAASASICGTVIFAVIIFICCYRSGRKKNEPEKQGGIPAILNPSPPLASLGALGSTKTDWDTLSMYSQRSIPRARMYHMDKDDTRSHISHVSSKSHSRSLADGQSQRSFSRMSGLHLASPHFVSPLSLTRPDLRLSRQSLVASQLGANYPLFGHTGGMLSRMASQRNERRRSRSKSRDRAGSRLSHAGSSHSLTGYDTDGWTDHDMDIYMTRNPTRGGLVQL